MIAPWLVRAGYRWLVLGCRNSGEDKKKLANVSPFMSCVVVLALIGSVAFVVTTWVEWCQQFEWANSGAVVDDAGCMG